MILALILLSAVIVTLTAVIIRMRGEVAHYPGVFIKYSYNHKKNSFRIVSSNDRAIKELADIIPKDQLIYCKEVFDDFMTNGTAEFMCESDGLTYNVSVSKGRKNYAYMFIHDITGIKKRGDRAYIDVLTGLPNRLAFTEEVRRVTSSARMNGRPFAIMFLDLDKFKSINDTYGHDAGDILLKQVAERLRGAVRGGDTVFRLAGDEFTIILPHLAKKEFAISIANRIITELTTPFQLNEQITVQIGTSIGISLFPEHGEVAEELINKADRAMYIAKRAGRGTYRIHGQE